MIVGNDVSEFQGNIDWNTYKNNSNFVIIRSTYGNGYIDKRFTQNRDGARSVGLSRGFYHYAYPQYNSPEDEANWCLQVLPDIQEGEIICLDYEEAWNGNVVDFCKRFLDRVSSKLNGYKSLIYLNQSLAQNYDWKPLVDAGYGLWIAAYTYDPNNNNFKIGAWKFAAMQQWTNKQQVPGLPGNVDGDVFFGDIAAFKKYGYKKPAPSTPLVDYQKLYNDTKQQFEDYKKTYIYKQSDFDNVVKKAKEDGRLSMKNDIINLINKI